MGEKKKEAEIYDLELGDLVFLTLLGPLSLVLSAGCGQFYSKENILFPTKEAVIYMSAGSMPFRIQRQLSGDGEMRGFKQYECVPIWKPSQCRDLEKNSRLFLKRVSSSTGR